MKRKIKISIVDNATPYLNFLSKLLSGEEDFEIKKINLKDDVCNEIRRWGADVVVCDIGIPEEKSVDLIKEITEKLKKKVVVVSFFKNSYKIAIKSGASFYMQTPKINSLDSSVEFSEDLIKKIKKVCDVKPIENEFVKENYVCGGGFDSTFKVIAIGASLGGVKSLNNIIPNLPRNMPPILISLHIPPVFSKIFAERLDELSLLKVKEAENGECVKNGVVYVCPGDKDMKIMKLGSSLRILCSDSNGKNHSPSIDKLFLSVADTLENKAIGIMLNGSLKDGSLGFLEMRNNGAFTIAESFKPTKLLNTPSSKIIEKSALRIVQLEDMPNLIKTLMNGYKENNKLMKFKKVTGDKKMNNDAIFLNKGNGEYEVQYSKHSFLKKGDILKTNEVVRVIYKYKKVLISDVVVI